MGQSILCLVSQLTGSIFKACKLGHFQGHRSTITGLFVLHKGFRILSAEEEGVINVWQAEDGTGLVCVEGPTRILHASPNDQLAISGDASQM